MPGNWVRPLTPPKAVPRQTRPVTSWKGPRTDLLACASDPNNNRLAPTLVAAFQRAAHQIHVADALKAVINSAICHINDHFGNAIGVSLSG